MLRALLEGVLGKLGWPRRPHPRKLRHRSREVAQVLRAARGPQAPLPGALARRLREMPRREILCRDLDREGPELVRGELAARRDAALRSHLEGCRRCGRVHAVLTAVLEEPPRPLPRRLALRLAALARPRAAAPALPRFLSDGRYAVAASAVVAVLLTTAAGGDPLAVASRAAEAAAARAREHGAAVPSIAEPPLGRARLWAESLGERLRHEAGAVWAAELARSRRYGGQLRETFRRRRAVLEAETGELTGRVPEMEAWVRLVLTGSSPEPPSAPPLASPGTAPDPGGETPGPSPEAP